MKKFLILFCAAALAAACGDKGTETITVASDQADCTGVAPQKCLLVKREGADRWEFWYTGIEGFDYRPGYEYVLEVRAETVDRPAADQSSIRYTLVREVSKTRKTSENMPADMNNNF